MAVRDRDSRRGDLSAPHTFEIRTKFDEKPITIISIQDAKTRFWEAKKCHYRCCEFTDVESGMVYVFDTSAVYLVIDVTGSGSHEDGYNN